MLGAQQKGRANELTPESWTSTLRGFCMSKYSLAFKQSVIAAYESGTEGARAVAARFDVDHSTVRKWAAAHAAHGVSGLVKKFGSFDASFKLSVLQRMWDDRAVVSPDGGIVQHPRQRLPARIGSDAIKRVVLTP